jgi:alkyl hydroperoxide reductase subunit D
MSISLLKDTIPDFARDIRLNLETVLTPEGAPGLSAVQIAGVALACSYAIEDQKLIAAIQSESVAVLGPEVVEAAKGAAAIMAMNNVYYRFLHLADDKEFSKMPAKLRMNIIGKPGIPKVDFELMSLAISAISGCGMCINAHIQEIKKAQISNEGIQSVVRIASVIQAAKRALTTVKIHELPQLG